MNSYFNRMLDGRYGSIDELKEAISHARENPVEGQNLLNRNGTIRYRGRVNLGGLYHESIWIPGYKLGDISLPDQQQMPENPGIRQHSFSALGVTIPISVGKRAVVGNVIDASPLEPRLVGYQEYEVTYKIPVYGTDVHGGGGGGTPAEIIINPQSWSSIPQYLHSIHGPSNPYTLDFTVSGGNPPYTWDYIVPSVGGVGITSDVIPTGDTTARLEFYYHAWWTGGVVITVSATDDNGAWTENKYDLSVG